MKYNKSFLDTYKKFISKGWYGSVIPTSTLERWCENFSSQQNDTFDPSICAYFLLNSLVFYQEKQLEAIIVQIQDKLISELNQKNEEMLNRRLSEDELQDIWSEYKKQSYIVSAALPREVADSAHHASRLWRNISGIDTGSIIELKDAIEAEGKKHIFFVDDFIGTGTKMTTFLSKQIFNNENLYGFKCVSDVIKSFKDSVDFNIAVFAIHNKGKTSILDEFPTIKFYFGDIYSEEYNLISDTCVLYEMFSEDKGNIIGYITNKLEEFNEDNKYALHLPVSFQHGCPNNSLALYYHSDQNWNKLLSESHPKRIKS